MRAIDADRMLGQIERGYEFLMEQMADRSAEVRGAMEDEKLLFTYAIHDAPTLDVAPVRHGKWVRDAKSRRFIHCSLCGTGKECFSSTEIWIQKTKKYCPYCGAKMDAGQEDDSHDGNKAG